MKKMSYQEILEEVLLSLDGERMSETISRIRATTKTRKKDKTIIKDIERFVQDEENPLICDAIYDYGTSDWIHKSEVFSEMAFLVRMNDYEWDKKTFVIGHRVVPFMDVSKINPGDLRFFMESGEELPYTRGELEFEDASSFMLFMPPYCTDNFIFLGENGVEMDTYDFSEFFKKENFKKDDLLEIIPKDWAKHEFLVKKKTQRDFKREGILMKGKSNILENALEEVLEEMYLGGSVLDYALFNAFAVDKTEMNNYAGKPIAQLVNDWASEERFYLDNSSGVVMIFLENPMDMMDMGALGDMMPFGFDDSFEDSLDGVLQEVGNSFDSNFVYVNYVLQLHKHNEIDIDAVMDLLFENRNNTFFLDAHKKELGRRMEEMKADVSKEWKDIRLSPEKQQFLKTGLEAKQKIVKILRELDKRMIMPEELDMEKMQPLMGMESMIDSLFEIVKQAKDIPGVLAKQFKEPFKELLTMIDEMEKGILADFD